MSLLKVGMIKMDLQTLKVTIMVTMSEEWMVMRQFMGLLLFQELMSLLPKRKLNRMNHPKAGIVMMGLPMFKVWTMEMM
mgnify:CR=1 FL=1